VANVKITELTALTNPASSDVLPIVDVGADETKKVTIADLLENAGSGTASAAAFAFDGDADTGMYRTGANALGFTTGGTGRLFIDSSGNVGIGAASPAVACDVVGQVRASTGILFGSDTAAANALDDYEEGTWTPALNWNNVTYTLQQGKYTKIGNRIFFSINLVWSANDASTLTSINLPFTSTSANERATISVQDVAIPGSFQYPVADIFASTVFVRYVNTSGTYITNYGVAANDAGRIAITGNYAVS